ncbi:MAG: YfhO family protein [Candidatus Omnitrophota bacterium]
MLLFAVLICAVYFQVAWGGKSLLSTLYYPHPFCNTDTEGRKPVNSFNIDLSTPAFYEMPVNKLTGNMYRGGILPLWNPYQAAGTPLAAQYSSRVFFPYQILENVLPWWTWDYFILGRLIISAFFTYLFLRLLNISFPCAFLGGIFYSLCGSFTWFINLEEFTNVAMMLPVCLFSLEKFILFKKKRHIGETALASAAMLLAGQPEIAIYVMLFLGAYYLTRTAVKNYKLLLKCLLQFILITVLGLGLAAFLIIPFLELIPNAYQCHPAGGTMGIQDPASLIIALGILIPSFFELPTYYRFFPHNGAWDCLGGYTGILLFFLIALAFCCNKGPLRRNFIFFSLFGLAIIFKNFGFPAILWIGRLPLLNQSWSPRWAGPVWTFSLSLAAACGMQIILNQTKIKKKIIWATSLFLSVIAAFLVNRTTYLSQFKGLDSAQLKAALPPIFGGILICVSVLAAAALLFSYCKNKERLMGSIICLALLELGFYIPKGAAFPWTALKLIPFVLGILAIIFLVKARWILSTGAGLAVVLSSIIIDIQSPYGFPQRCNLFNEPGYIRFLKQDNTDFSRIVAEGTALIPNFSSAFSLLDIRYINSLSLAHYQNYVDRHLLKEPHAWITDRLWFTGIADLHKTNPRSIYQEINDNFLYYSYLGVKYILTPQSICLNLPLVYYDAAIKIYKNPQSFPRAYMACLPIAAKDFQEAQDLMRTKDLKNTVILEEPPPEWYAPAGAVSPQSVHIDKYLPQQVKISADLNSDGILVLTDTFYPGWHAYIDNQEEKIYRVNGLARGIFIKKGKHNIVFTYSPCSFKIGVLISSVSLLICLAMIFTRKR